MKKVTTQTIGRYVYTLTIDNENLIATMTRPVKSRLGVKFEINHKFNTREFMDKFVLQEIARIQGYEKNVAERKQNKKTKKTPAGYLKDKLNKAFPGVNFSCRYEIYSGGNSIHVNWIDGPSLESVELIANQHQYGHFDGMEDIYIYNDVTDMEKQAKYVSCSRQFSKDINEKVRDIVYSQPKIGNIDEYTQYRRDNGLFWDLKKKMPIIDGEFDIDAIESDYKFSKYELER